MNEHITSQPAPAVGSMALLDAYDTLVEGLPGARTPWLKTTRDRAIASLRKNGIPNRKSESWRYTDLKAWLDKAPAFDSTIPEPDGSAIAAIIDNTVARIGLDDALVCVLVDGVYSPDYSRLGGLPDGVVLDPLATLIDRHDGRLAEHVDLDTLEFAEPVLALSTAFMSEGIGVRIDNEIDLATPLLFLFVSSAGAPAARAVRLMFDLAPGASAKIIQAHVGLNGAAGMMFLASDIFLDESARLDLIKFQDEPHTSRHFAHNRVHLADNAHYAGFTFSLGGEVSRHQTHVSFKGQNAHANISGAFMITGTQHCDNTIDVDHATPSCASVENFKGVIAGNARGVFQGRITVAPDAQKVDGRQMSQALLLSETAEFDAKPELKIYADDVQCAHGATAGEIDEDLLFYLRARGIPEDAARALLIAAFVGEAFEEISDAGIRDTFSEIAADWLGGEEGRG